MLGGVGPAAVFAGDGPARRGEFEVVRPLAGTADLKRFGFPYGVMVMLASDEGVRDFMKDGVADVSFVPACGMVD